MALSVLFLWITFDYWGEKYFVLIGSLFIFLFVLYPAIRAYKIFMENNKPVIENTLCSSCRHFDTSAVLCMKYDKHPSVSYIPCEGNDWELRS
jgi:hypothetical protein